MIDFKGQALTNSPSLGGGGSSSGSAGYIQYSNGASGFSAESILFWDATNNRLGIGTASPSHQLDVYPTNEDLTVRCKASTNYNVTLDLDRGSSADALKINFKSGGSVDWWTQISRDAASDFQLFSNTAGVVMTLVKATGLVKFAGSVQSGSSSVASGTNAIALGDACTASNTCAIAVGQGSTASGSHSAVVGGYLSTASGAYSFATGLAASALGDVSVAFIRGTASALYSFAAGHYAEANKTYSVAFGNQTKTPWTGSMVCGHWGTYNGGAVTATSGEITTTDATPSPLFISSSTELFFIPTGAVFSGRATIQASTAGAASCGTWMVNFIIRNNAGTVSIHVGTMESLGTNSGNVPSGWSIALTADNTNKALLCTVTGVAATTIKWRMGLSGLYSTY